MDAQEALEKLKNVDDDEPLTSVPNSKSLLPSSEEESIDFNVEEQQ